MKFVADLHLHSKYSRAVSQQMTLSNMANWAKFKGINVLATGDFTHPFWFDALKTGLEDAGNGLFRIKSRESRVEDKEVYFMLSAEISSIYSQGGKTRRIHTLFMFPSLESVDKFNKELVKRRANLRSDGRPIVGINSKDLVKIALGVDEKALVIPAHCLHPDEFIHTKAGIKKIKDIQAGDYVYTHKNRARKVTEVYKRDFRGEIYHIRPWYFSMGTKVTGEHPFYAYKTTNCSSTGDRCIPTAAHKRICRHNFYKDYKAEWIPAELLEEEDILVFPRFKNTTPLNSISLEPLVNSTVLSDQILTGGNRGRSFRKEVMLTKEFCRLVGYYLAEGYTNGRDEIAFAFHEKETEYIEDVIDLMQKVFGFSHYRVYKRNGTKGVEISFYSKLIVKFFTSHFYTGIPLRAINKTVPDWMLHLPEEYQAEILRGWWRGDQGYTSSRYLMDGMKVICLRLGIIPSVFQDSLENYQRRGNHGYNGRNIKANSDLFSLNRLAFFEDQFNLLSDSSFKKNVRKLTRKHGWIDENYIYIPVRAIEKIPYKGEVFNLEVEEDNSYLAEFSAVHNCWTPWFSIFGSFSGFDSIEECFGDMAKYIYGIETGLSSDPVMNWQISDLDNRSILSFSDAHSLEKMGREATVFDSPEVSYDAIYNAIAAKDTKSKIAFTIEFYPEEGKYHFTGHRNCNYSQGPDKDKNAPCPVCGKSMTIGVMDRVEELKSRETRVESLEIDGVKWQKSPQGRPPYVNLVPLGEIIAEAFGVGVGTQKVKDVYSILVSNLGSEFGVLLKSSIADIARFAGGRVAESIAKVRHGDLVIEPGYDNQFGVVKIWGDAKNDKVVEEEMESQLNLFV